jgi:tetratricopeptide (TPR) repeat protein
MEELETVRYLIGEGHIDEAISTLNQYVQTSSEQKDEAFYLRGNAYRKLSNWKQALNDYQSAIDINPESPAKQAREMLMDILNFYNPEYV